MPPTSSSVDSTSLIAPSSVDSTSLSSVDSTSLSSVGSTMLIAPSSVESGPQSLPPKTDCQGLGRANVAEYVLQLSAHQS